VVSETELTTSSKTPNLAAEETSETPEHLPQPPETSPAPKPLPTSLARPWRCMFLLVAFVCPVTLLNFARTGETWWELVGASSFTTSGGEFAGVEETVAYRTSFQDQDLELVASLLKNNTPPLFKRRTFCSSLRSSHIPPMSVTNKLLLVASLLAIPRHRIYSALLLVFVRQDYIPGK